MKGIDLSRKQELDKILVAVVKSLDITRTQFENLSQSYNAVGKYLESDPIFEPYHPIVTPQGSLRLGTIIQPVNDGDDLDVDLVYRLLGKSTNWTQSDIKRLVGKRLKEHGTYREMLDKEGRRCWTLLYRQESNNVKEHYHMDILPCVADKEHNSTLRSVLTANYSPENVKRVAICITDNKSADYFTSTDTNTWLKSNPDGYAIWFASRCKNTTEIRENILNAIMPIGQYVEDKTILQRIVQLLKRHRDIMFGDDDEKPISIIITTLAGRAYNGETCLFDGLCNIIDNMELYIHLEGGTYVVNNPVNPKENFADKWAECPKKKEKFFAWLSNLKMLKDNLIHLKGLQLRETLSVAFGKRPVQNVFDELTTRHKEDASTGKLRVASTGMLGVVGTTLNASNTFFGEE